MFCENCGKTLPENVRFCENCGAKTEGAAARPQAPPTQSSYAPPQYRQPPPQHQNQQYQQYTPQQYAPQPQYTPQQQQAQWPPQQQQYSQPPQQQYAPQPQFPPPQYAPQQYHGSSRAPAAPEKRKSGRLAYRIVAAILIVVLGASAGTAYFLNRGGAGGERVARGSSASVSDGIIELDGATLSFLGNNVTSATRMTVLKPNASQNPDGIVSGLFEVSLDSACNSPVTLALPVDEDAIPDDENAAVLLGIGSRFEDDGGGYTTYTYMPAEISNGVASATFIPASFLQGLVTHGDEGGMRTPASGLFTAHIAIKRAHVLFLDMEGAAYPVPANFIIYSPYARIDADASTEQEREAEALFQRINSDDVEMLQAIFYAFYKDFGDLYNSRTVWPFQVYYDPDFSGGARYELSTIQYDAGSPDSGQIYWNGNPADGIIRIGRNYWGGSGYSQSSLEAKFLHEFSHWIIACYTQSNGLSYNDRRWADEAFASFCVKSFTGRFDAETNDNYKLLFDGLIPETQNAAEGYARALLLWHCANWTENDTPLASYGKAYLEFCLSNGNGLLDDFISANPEHRIINFFEALIGFSGRLDRAFGELPDYYSEAVSGSLGAPLVLDIPEQTEAEEAESAVAGRVSLSVNYYGARFAAIMFTDELLRAMGEMPETADISIDLTGDGDLKLFAVSPTGERAEGADALEDLPERVASGWKYLVMVVGYESGRTDYTVTVTFGSGYPTLDEIEGLYVNSVLVITDVSINPAYASFMEAASSGTADALLETGEIGCDPAMMLGMLQELIGQENPIFISITKTGVNTGTLIMGNLDEIDSGETPDEMTVLSFTYSNGVIRASKTVSDEGFITALTLEIKAAYGPGNDSIVLGGTFTAVYSVSSPAYSGEAFILYMNLNATKPLQ